MANYYAHLQFGNQVLSMLPDTLKIRLERERAAFHMGQFGPDPLFFYRPLMPNGAKALGHAMHRQPARPVAERLRRAVEDGAPFASGYAAGFLCHFGLDSQCHRYIARVTKERKVTHAGIEAEFDRLWMLKNGLDPLKDTPLPDIQLPAEFYEMLAQYVYQGATGPQFERGYRTYSAFCRWQTWAAGRSWVKGCVDWLARTIPHCTFFQDMIIEPQTGAQYQRCSKELLAVFQRAAERTAEEVSAFFESIARREPLGSWYDQDFSGISVDYSGEAVAS